MLLFAFSKSQLLFIGNSRVWSFFVHLQTQHTPTLNEKIAPNQNGSKLRGRAKLDEESLAFDERSHLAYSLIADQISAPVLSAPTDLLREQIRWSTAPTVLGQTEPAEPPNRTPDPAAPSDLVLLLGTNRMRPGGGSTRKHDRRGPNGQLPCILDRQRRLSGTLRDHVRSASALSALKKSLVANLSAKRQLSVAKLSAKRIFSLAKRDFLVANGRMAADFSSPDDVLIRGEHWIVKSRRSCMLSPAHVCLRGDWGIRGRGEI